MSMGSPKKTLNKPEIHAHEIMPGIWLGDETSSQDADFIKANNIEVIINCTKHIDSNFKNIDYYRIPINDPGPTSDPDQEDNVLMLKHLTYVIPYINEAKSKNRVILIHCHAGRIRSASVLLCYLLIHVFTMGEKKDRLKDALACIISKRPQAFHYGTATSFKPAICIFMYQI